MRKFLMLPTAATIFFATGLLWATGTVNSNVASPGTINFTANLPGSSIAGSSTASETWNVINASNNDLWTLKVGAAASSFPGCATVPTSAVTLSCTSLTMNVGTGQSGGTCTTGTFTLSTTPQQVASGKEGPGTNKFTAVLTYNFADSWKYVANTCPLTITYTVSP
jgi:hypothetical protein